MLALALTGASAQTPPVGAAAATASPDERLTGDIVPVHDPVIIREGDTCHVFSAGIGPAGQGIVLSRTSRDLMHWERGAAPFERLPDWATTTIPGARNIWAPDVSYVNGRYRLYYAASRSARTAWRSGWRPARRSIPPSLARLARRGAGVAVDAGERQ